MFKRSVSRKYSKHLIFMSTAVKKKRSPQSPPSRVLRPRVTAQLPSTSSSPPSSSRAKRKRISSVTKKYSTKSVTKVPPSTPQQGECVPPSPPQWGVCVPPSPPQQGRCVPPSTPQWGGCVPPSPPPWGGCVPPSPPQCGGCVLVYCVVDVSMSWL